MGVVLVDGGWRVVFANRAAAERVVSRADQLVAAPSADLFAAGESVVRRLQEALASDALRAHLTDVAMSRSSAMGAGPDAVADVWAERLGEGAPGGAHAVVTLVDASSRTALRDELNRLREQLARAERARERLGAIQRETAGDFSTPPDIIGGSAPMLRVFDQIERVATADATVLVHGETGSGKDLIARAIHAKSRRAHQAFIAVNCAALPETLIESELFGHERGAFTGADRQRLGKFELADTGTLFLDEIAELSPAAQAKLLRVLQNGLFERVGGAETIRVDVRLIAATHRDLAKQVERGRFREDLFYRLNVFRIDAPPLRDRRDDLRALIEFLHEKHARRMGRPALPLSERSMRRVLAYRWPGNVRELENSVERATLLADGPELEIELPDAPTPGQGGEGGRSGRNEETPRDVLLDLTAEQLQRLQIMHALETNDYRVFGDDGAAKKLGMNPQTLLSRMDKLGIPRPRQMRARMRG
ncbi:MAG: sigma-54-dependent Fis family transcriptional regulator [Phycisphaeraceae bacterium]|nr:sigma-54-dependent Fis family transcriptional regulator [Phycisphaeraceae bacterium]